jgi:hypothetical protein
MQTPVRSRELGSVDPASWEDALQDIGRVLGPPFRIRALFGIFLMSILIWIGIWFATQALVAAL